MKTRKPTARIETLRSEQYRVDGELSIVPQKTPEPPVIAVIQRAKSASQPVFSHGR
jgi:hypothetical protein